MSTPQRGRGGDIRDVHEDDAGSYHWADSPSASMRPDARPVAPFDDTDLATALGAPMVSRWMSVTPADPADPRSISMHVRDGRVDAGPKGLHGAALHDLASVGGTVPHAHARNRIPVRGTDHRDFAVAKGSPPPLHREATAYAVHAALARVPGPTTGHVGSQRPADRPMRPGTGDGEIELAPPTATGATSGPDSGATSAVMETATGAGLPIDHSRRWQTFTYDHAPGRTVRPVHAFTEQGLVTKGPRGLLGARREHLESLHEVATLTHRLGVRPKGHNRQPDYAEATHAVRPLSRPVASLGLLQAFNVANPAAYNNGQVATEPDSDDTAAASTTAPVSETSGQVTTRPYRAPAPRTPKAARSSGYTMPTAPASAPANTAEVREVSGRVETRPFRQYRSSGFGATSARSRSGYTFPVDQYQQYPVKGIPIAARESDAARLVAVAFAGIPAGADTDRTPQTGRASADAGGAVQGIGHDGPPVLARIQEFLASWQPAHVVGALVTSDDLTVLEGALAVKTRISVVMGLSAFDTRLRLVEDAPHTAAGVSIGARFDRLLATVRADGGSIYGSAGDALAGRILNESLGLARQHTSLGHAPADFVRCVIVVEGAIDDGDTGADAGYGLAKLARLHGVETTLISHDGGAR